MSMLSSDHIDALNEFAKAPYNVKRGSIAAAIEQLIAGGNLDRATEACELLDCMVNSNDFRAKWDAITYRGHIAIKKGSFQEGVSLQKSAYDLAYENNNLSYLCRSGINLAEASRKSDDLKGAEIIYCNLLDIIDKNANSLPDNDDFKQIFSGIYTNYGALLAELGDYKKALKYQLKGIDIDNDLGDPRLQLKSYQCIANLYIKLKKLDDAYSNLLNARALSTEVCDRFSEIEILISLTRVTSILGDEKASRKYYSEAKKIADDTKIPFLILQVKLAESACI